MKALARPLLPPCAPRMRMHVSARVGACDHACARLRLIRRSCLHASHACSPPPHAGRFSGEGSAAMLHQSGEAGEAESVAEVGPGHHGSMVLGGLQVRACVCMRACVCVHVCMCVCACFGLHIYCVVLHAFVLECHKCGWADGGAGMRCCDLFCTAAKP